MNHRPGFALMMVLLILLIVGLLTASLARASMRRVQQAASAESDLQRRWGMLSARFTLLPRIESLLRDAEIQSGRPHARLPIRVRLGALHFDFQLTDEQAKAHFAMLCAGSEFWLADQRLRSLLPPGTPTESAVPAIRRFCLSPSTESPSTVDAQLNFTLLMPDLPPGRYVDPPGNRPAISDLLTFWSDGRLNLLRADPRAIHAICSPHLTSDQIDLLLRLRLDDLQVDRSESSKPGRPTMAANLQMTDQAQAALRNRMTFGSTCHGLWIVVSDGRREWHQQAIRRSMTASPAGDPAKTGGDVRKSTYEDFLYHW